MTVLTATEQKPIDILMYHDVERYLKGNYLIFAYGIFGRARA